jgi:predicted outer membrane repeat protein
MTPDTISRALRVRAALLAATVSTLFPAMAHGATHDVDAASAACSDTTGTPFCTVQAAINAASPGDRIEVAAGSYIETLTIDRNLTLHGAGISAVEGACDGQTNLLGAPAITVQAGVIVLLTDVTIKGGTGSFGGGVNNAGILFLASSEVCQNSAFNQGGGIYTSGALSLTRMQVYDNSQASAGVEGGGLFVAGGRALVRNSTFTNNRVTRGGGISVAVGGTLVLSRSTLRLNFADGTFPSVLSNQGGGLNNSGIAIIDQTEIGENSIIASTGLGAGIFNNGVLVMARSTLHGNGIDRVAGAPAPVGLGAGLYSNGIATISISTVSGNLFNPLILAPGDRGPVQAHAGALEDVLAQRRRLRADDVAVGARQVGVEAGGEADRHRQRRRGRARRAVAHADAHRAVGDPEAGDPQLVDRPHVALDLDLLGELVHVRAGFRGLGGDRVDVDRLHGAVELSDLLLERHGLDELAGPLPG